MSYAGDVSCSECWKELNEAPDSQLIDVRTSAEWAFVGIPDLSRTNKSVVLVEWQGYPTMQVNANFVESVEKRLSQSGTSKDAPIFTICRSGARSISAAQALTLAGYENVKNVLCGFEGDPDHEGHRGLVSGWKCDGLPWRQN